MGRFRRHFGGPGGSISASSGSISGSFWRSGGSFGRLRGPLGRLLGDLGPLPGPDGEKVVKKSVCGSPGAIFGTFSVFFASLFGVVFEGAFGGARELIFRGFGDDF